MIQNDQELAVTQERVAYFLNLLRQMRVASRPDEFPLVAGGYRAEVEKMQREVLDYIHTQIAIAEQGAPLDTPQAQAEPGEQTE